MLHPQARALLDLMIERGIPPVHTQSPTEARVAYRDRKSYTQPPPPEVGAVADHVIDTPDGHRITLRLYRPLQSQADAELPVLMYFHGGGWTIGDLETHDTLCRQLANGAACAVVSVDYRMGPEHRFPAAVEDCMAATQWVHANARMLHVDAQRIALGGDSAGGNLAAVVALMIRDAGLKDLHSAIRFQLLIYPATDMRRVAPSHQSNGQGYLLTTESMQYYRDHYMGPQGNDADWRASPLLHSSLTGLAPALVLTAGYDPLRDEGLQYAQRLSEAGVSTSYLCFERQIHGFILMGRVLEEAHTAVELCAASLRRAFSGGG